MSLLLKTTLGILAVSAIVFVVWNYNQNNLNNDGNAGYSTEESDSQKYPKNNNEDLDKDLVEIDNELKLIEQDSHDMDSSANDKPIN